MPCYYSNSDHNNSGCCNKMLTFFTSGPKVSISTHANKSINIHVYTCSSIITGWTGTGCPWYWNLSTVKTNYGLKKRVHQFRTMNIRAGSSVEWHEFFVSRTTGRSFKNVSSSSIFPRLSQWVSNQLISHNNVRFLRFLKNRIHLGVVCATFISRKKNWTVYEPGVLSTSIDLILTNNRFFQSC